MKFNEIDVFGVYIAPISAMMFFAWLFVILILRSKLYLGMARFVWHPSLFAFSLYLITLSVIVLAAAR